MSELIEMALMEAEEKMDKALEVAREDMASIRTGRAGSEMSMRMPLPSHAPAASPTAG